MTKLSWIYEKAETIFFCMIIFTAIVSGMIIIFLPMYKDFGLVLLAVSIILVLATCVSYAIDRIASHD